MRIDGILGVVITLETTPLGCPPIRPCVLSNTPKSFANRPYRFNSTKICFRPRIPSATKGKTARKPERKKPPSTGRFRVSDASGEDADGVAAGDAGAAVLEDRGVAVAHLEGEMVDRRLERHVVALLAVHEDSLVGSPLPRPRLATASFVRRTTATWA